jgi:hypothetical protein
VVHYRIPKCPSGIIRHVKCLLVTDVSKVHTFNFTVIQFQDCLTALFTIRHSKTFQNTGIISNTPERDLNVT